MSMRLTALPIEPQHAHVLPGGSSDIRVVRSTGFGFMVSLASHSRV